MADFTSADSLVAPEAATSTASHATRAALLRAEPAVSWSAVLAGAVASLAVSFVVLALAAGLGLHAAGLAIAGSDAANGFTPVAGAGMVAGQVLASGLGGYLAGRLRGHWAGVHGDETHFRDTAHGLLAWAVATLVGAVFAAGVLSPHGGGATADSTGAVIATGPAAAEAAERLAQLGAQAAFFTAVGMVLSAFIAAVAAAVGGHRTEEMLRKA